MSSCSISVFGLVLQLELNVPWLVSSFITIFSRCASWIANGWDLCWHISSSGQGSWHSSGKSSGEIPSTSRWLFYAFETASVASQRSFTWIHQGLRLPSDLIVQQDHFRMWNLWQHPCLLTLNCTLQGNCWQLFSPGLWWLSYPRLLTLNCTH